MNLFLRSLFRPESPVREPWELRLLRLGIVLLLIWQVPLSATGAVSQPHPHGFARWGLDFTWMGNPAWFTPLLGLYFLAVLVYALGLAVIGPLVIVLLFQTSASTLNLSQGVQGHSGQIIGLTVLGMILAAAVHRSRPADGQVVKKWRRPSPELHAQTFSGAMQAIAATYVAAGVTKLVLSDGEWLSRAKNFVLQWRKAADETLYTTGVEPGGAAEWFGSLLMNHAWVAPVFLGAGLLLELGTPLALLNRRISLLTGLCLIGFHQSLNLVMSLPFYYNQYLVLLLYINPVWWALRTRGPARGNEVAAPAPLTK